MMDEQQLPLSLGNVPPGEGAINYKGVRLDGLPNGVHTGGVWFWNDLAWKPMDCLPYLNCEYRTSTNELQALTSLADYPLFPRNWWVEESNGRQWIVRQICHIYQPGEISQEQLEQIRSGIRSTNLSQWEINDEITVGLDPAGQLFIVDMSSARYCIVPKGAYAANDIERFWQFASGMGFTLFCNRRNAARKARQKHSESLYNKGLSLYPTYVYGSYYRPLSRLWATKLPKEAVLIDDQVSQSTPHTWIFVDNEIDPAIVKSYELTLCDEDW